MSIIDYDNTDLLFYITGAMPDSEITDLSGNKTVTVNGASPFTVDDVEGVSFDGVNDYLSISPALDINGHDQENSIVGMVYWDGETGSYFVISGGSTWADCGRRFRVQITSAGNMSILHGQINSNNPRAGVSAGTLNEGWNTFGVNWDGPNQEINCWKNGEYVGSSGNQYSGTIGLGVAPYWVGRIHASSYYKGIHSAIKIFNRQLSAVEHEIIHADFMGEGTFFVEGSVTIDGSPASIPLKIHDASDWELLDAINSDETGHYSWQSAAGREVYVVALPGTGRRPEIHGPLSAIDES
jgi:hypothetical protein